MVGLEIHLPVCVLIEWSVVSSKQSRSARNERRLQPPNLTATSPSSGHAVDLHYHAGNVLLMISPALGLSQFMSLPPELGMETRWLGATGRGSTEVETRLLAIETQICRVDQTLLQDGNVLVNPGWQSITEMAPIRASPITRPASKQTHCLGSGNVEP